MLYKKIPFAWIVHGYPSGHQTNATPDDEQYVQDYYKNFLQQLNTPSNPGEQFIKQTLPNGHIAYTMARTGIYAANERKSEPNYAAVTIFIDSKYKTLDENFLKRRLNDWFQKNILNQFTQWEEKRRGLFNKTEGYYWKKNYTDLFDHQYDNELTRSLESIIQSSFQERTTVQQTNKPINTPQIPTQQQNQTPQQPTVTTQQKPEPAANNTTKKKLYSMSIIDGRLYKPKPTPDDDTVFELTETAPGTYEIDIYPPAHKRILANPSFLEGCKKQIVGNKIVKVIERGIARDNGMGKLIVEKAPDVHLLTPEMAESKMYNTQQTTIDNDQTTNDTLYADFIVDGTLSHVTQKPTDDTNFVLTQISPDQYKLSLYEPAYPRILRNPAAFLQGTDKQVIGRNIVQIKEFGTVKKDAFSGKFKVEKKLKVWLLDKERTETLQQKPEPAANNTTKKKLYSMSIIDGRLVRPKPTPDEDTNFELTETAPGTYEIDIYPPAHKRILANPSFLEGCDKQIVGKKIVKVIERGIARDNGLGKLIVVKPPVVHTLDREAENTTNKTNAEKIAIFDKGRKQLEDEIEELEKEIQEKQQLLMQKRAQLEQMGNQNT